MALPNGDLITTVFDPQMAYPVDKRMQVDTLNSRDSISMFIRWEGMQVYVLENSKIYILQGGRSNEYWKELGIGSGTGGTTFVGQFATADLLPTSGRSPGDYAFVGTGDDFVQYNWDSISGQWVMAEGQTDLASEHFHIGYKTPLRRPVIFRRDPKDVIIEDLGDIIIDTGGESANFILTGEVTSVRGIISATDGREIHLTNRTGSDVLLVDEYTSTAAENRFNFSGSDYTLENGLTISLKSESDRWVLGPVNEVAFSDTLDSVNATRSIGPDGMEVIDNVLDSNTGKRITLKQVTTYLDGTAMDDTKVDGLIYLKQHNEYLKKVIGTVDLNVLGVKIENTASQNADAFNAAQSNFPHNCRWSLETGTYRIDDISITKSGVYDFQGVNLINNLEVAGSSISVTTDADTVYINGLSAKYEGVFYTGGKPEYEGPLGVSKHGLRAECKKAVLTNCKFTGFSGQGILSSTDNNGLYLIACISNNNGYAGVLCNSTDFQVIGGEYNENGGSNSSVDGYGDGYGVVANVREYGNAKIIGVTSCRNRTRNIDSHNGQDIIIQSNYVEEAGAAHPQWFDKPFVNGNNIRFTQRTRRIIISNNISKKATLSGILCQSNDEGGVNEWYAESVIISNNILDDNLRNIYIRTLKTKSLVIGGNQSFASENISTHDLFIDAQTAELGTVGDLILSGNFFSKFSQISLPTTAEPENSNVKIFGNTIPSMLVLCNTANANIKTDNNNLGSFTVTGTNANAKARVVHNTISGAAPTLSSFSGHVTISENDISDVSGSTLIIVGGQTSIERNNFYNCVASDRIISMTSSVPENIRIIGNYFHSDCSAVDIIRFYPKSTVVVRDNDFTGRVTIVKSDGAQRPNDLVTFDPINQEFDIGINYTMSPPFLGDYSFSRGDIVKNSSPTLNTPIGYVCVDTSGTWQPFGFIGTRSTIFDAVHITSDFDLTTAPTESFNLYDTNTANFIGSPDDTKAWNIQRTKAADHAVAVEIAIERSSGGDMYTRVYAVGAWSAWKKINILDASGNAVIANTKKVGNGVANSENWIQYGNGANIYNVPSGQQHIFRQNGTTVAGISGDGKFFVEGVGKGIILKSPDGTQYEITVPDGGGSLTVTEV